MAHSNYQVVIGLEVHAQLMTKSKLFCNDSTTYGAGPNTQVSPVSLAHPGTLPKLNKKSIELATRLGLALGCDIERNNYFARKNYFYPDLPKGFQVTQHTAPICKNGCVTIKTADGQKDVLLNRIHMEEDAGKSIHDIDPDFTCIDLNRAGVPLLEIVTEPCIHSADEAFAFLTELRLMLRWLSVCDGNMEEGSMRCDANISVRPVGDTKLGIRVEVKNLNSIRNVKRAIEIESERLISLIENNERITQETRSFDADKQTTFSLRSKEEAEDYRYFPEPDLPSFTITDEFLMMVNNSLPVLPAVLKDTLIKEYSLSDYDAAVLCSDKEIADYYMQVASCTNLYKSAANWVIGPVKQYVNENRLAFSFFPLPANKLAELIELTETGKVNFSNASTRLFKSIIDDPSVTAADAAVSLNLIQESDGQALEAWIAEVLTAMPDKVKEYKSGKKGLIGLFAGEVKKKSKGKADMNLVTKLLADQLNQ